MKKVGCIAMLAGTLAVVFAAPVSSAPVHVAFDGSISGTIGYYTHVLADYGVGTHASFDLTFDDSDIPAPVSFSSGDLAPLSGSLQLGTDQWALNYGSAAFSYFPGPGIVGFQTRFTGTGPGTHSGGVLSYLYFDLTPELALIDDSIKVGFAYEDGSITRYSYAALTGDFDIERTTSVPAPGTALLMLSAIALLWRSRRGRGRKRSAALTHWRSLAPANV